MDGWMDGGMLLLKGHIPTGGALPPDLAYQVRAGVTAQSAVPWSEPSARRLA
jgi:hypothetical protein